MQMELNKFSIGKRWLEKSRVAFVSKHNSNCKKQVIILMIPDGEGWHHLAVKNYQYY